MTEVKKKDPEILADFASVLNSRATHPVFWNQGHKIWQLTFRFSHSLIHMKLYKGVHKQIIFSYTLYWEKSYIKWSWDCLGKFNLSGHQDQTCSLKMLENKNNFFETPKQTFIILSV